LPARAGTADERIVRRDAALVGQAQRLADVICETLRTDANAVVVLRTAAEPVAAADRAVQRAVGTGQHAPAGRVARVLPRVRHEDLADTGQLAGLEAPARDREREQAVRALLRIGRVNE